MLSFWLQLGTCNDQIKSLQAELEHLQTEYKIVDRQRVKALQVIKKSCVVPHTHDLRSFRMRKRDSYYVKLLKIMTKQNGIQLN